MFASIRRYRLTRGLMDELARLVDEGFAEEISAQPGFVSYEFMDCGEGGVITVSVFGTAEGADGSRDLARRWTEENLEEFEFSRIEALRGTILVSRAAQEMLAPGHAGTGGRFASVRRYRLRGGGSVGELMHIVDEVFADRIQEMDGFEAYHALDCGGEILSISLFRDAYTAAESDELALEFVRDELGDFDLERTEVIGAQVAVARAVADLLVPAHA